MKPVLPSFLTKPFGIVFTVAVIVLVASLAFVAFASSVVRGSAADCMVVAKSLSGSEMARHAGRIETVGCNGSTETKIFEVTNNVLAGETKADEIFSQIEVGKIYTFSTLGVRIRPFMTENITGIIAK